MQELPDHNDASLWGKVAECNRVLGDEEEMISVYEAIIQDEQVHVSKPPCYAWATHSPQFGLQLIIIPACPVSYHLTMKHRLVS